MELEEVKIVPENGTNVIVGGTHFIKSVEDIYETLIESGAVSFGVAFCEASGPRLIRFDGNDEKAIKLAVEYAQRIGAGHSFVVVLTKGFPINVLNRLKSVSEVTSVYVATANPFSVIIAKAGESRAILGVADGGSPLGVEDESEKGERKHFLKQIGYKR